MTTYHPYKVKLSNGQKHRLAKAYQSNSPITIRLTKMNCLEMMNYY